MLYLKNVESEYPQLVGDSTIIFLSELFTADDAVLSQDEYRKALWHRLKHSAGTRCQLATVALAVDHGQLDLDPLPGTIHRVLTNAIDWFLRDDYRSLEIVA